MSGEPFSKSQQLRRASPRYRRIVLHGKAWERLWSEKRGPCRVCRRRDGVIDPHHIVFREDGGDDCRDNIAPVCRDDHDALHNRAPAIVRLFLASLSDAEYAYAIRRGGEDYFERAYGLEYERGAALSALRKEDE